MGLYATLTEILPLKWEDDKEPIYPLADHLHPTLLPRPHLGRDVVEGGDPHRVGKLSDLEIEARVVDMYHHIGPKGHNITLTLIQLREDCAKMPEHIRNTKERCLLIVLSQILPAAHLGHTITSPEAEHRLGVGLKYALHKVGTVKVATRLSCNQIVSHFAPLISTNRASKVWSFRRPALPSKPQSWQSYRRSAPRAHANH